MSTVHDIPDSIETYSGTASWRIADGKFCRGREATGTLETREKILGYLRRVGIHEDTLDDGSEYAKLECDLETREGVVSVGATLRSATTGKPTYSSLLGLGHILLQLKPGELVQLETRQSAKVNRYGKYTTYVNGYRVDPVTLKPTPIERTASEDSLEAQVEEMVEQVKNHPAFALRAKRASRDDDGDGAFYAFCAATESNNWPRFDQAEDEYLAFAAKAAKQPQPYKRAADVPDEVWLGLAKEVEKRGSTKIPAALAAKTASDSTGYDPFA